MDAAEARPGEAMPELQATEMGHASMERPLKGAVKFGEPRPTLRTCETCPFLKKNHGKKHPAKWYSTANLRRLWSGLRSGRAPGMICHSTDPNSREYGGTAAIRPGQEAACAGALLIILQNVNAFAAGRPQPFTPPISRAVMADIAWKHLTGTLPHVEDRSSEVGLPWIVDSPTAKRKTNKKGNQKP